MEDQVKKFLQFNGKNVYFKSAEGIWWIAIKPICEAMEVNYDWQFKNLKSTKIFSELYANQHMVDANGSVRKMICLPEKAIYFWLAKLESDAPGFDEFQWECNNLLYNYFHGTITERTTSLREKTKLDLEIEKIKEELKTVPLALKLQELINKRVGVKKELRRLDEDIVNSQLELWQSEPVMHD